MESQTTSIAAARPPQFETSEQSRDALCRVFANARRRATLRVLATHDDAIEIDALAEAVVGEEFEDEGDDERTDRVLVSLYHNHLPMLADCDLLEVDRRGERVFVHPNTADIAALL
ncbi:DUF7344 domain-containing protein [Halomarina litorea]|uniref:DUF7344 domain-containing protein n=1 Tax=Halomarina litorea TaxID=2961595 RepID=UPI0020C24AB1|nr:hypothetical protein [Halomarina sp. BCD28]